MTLRELVNYIEQQVKADEFTPRALLYAKAVYRFADTLRKDMTIEIGAVDVDEWCEEFAVVASEHLTASTITIYTSRFRKAIEVGLGEHVLQERYRCKSTEWQGGELHIHVHIHIEEAE